MKWFDRRWGFCGSNRQIQSYDSASRGSCLLFCITATTNNTQIDWIMDIFLWNGKPAFGAGKVMFNWRSTFWYFRVPSSNRTNRAWTMYLLVADDQMRISEFCIFVTFQIGKNDRRLFDSYIFVISWFLQLECCGQKKVGRMNIISYNNLPTQLMRFKLVLFNSSKWSNYDEIKTFQIICIQINLN